ncbi:MAG: hypothetical protein OXI15_02315 [Chromatiales bacterium]|nr:hypothetical protein [Chromatiales bacterium]
MTTYFTPDPRLPFHRETGDRPRGRILEVSTRSPDNLGRQLSAMNLRAADDPQRRPVEAVYQAAKIYGAGGPATPARSGYEAKRIDRERRRQGPLAGFEHAGRRWPLDTGTAFYDWLWARSALACYGPKIIERLQEYDGFTDQFHRPGAKACQAKTAAIVAGMGERTRRAAADPDAWLLEVNPARAAAPDGRRRYAGIGSRQTPAEVLDRMRSIGAAMAEAGWLLRSGAAQGADSAFEAGAANAGGDREIWIPWNRYNGRTPDDPAVRIARNNDANRAIAAKRHPIWHDLGQGAQKLMVRNVHQILGEDPDVPAAVDIVLCWTEGGRGSGGTGMALRLAADHRIPIVDLGADRTRLARAVTHAVDRGLPGDVARLISQPERTDQPVQEAPANTRFTRVARALVRLGGDHSRMVARARELGIPDAAQISTPTRQADPAATHRIVVTGESRPSDRAAIDAHLAKLAAKHPALTIVPAGQSAGDTAIAWAEANGHRVAYPRARTSTEREPPSTRAARILDPRPDLVLDCSAHWDFRAQTVVLAAETDSIPVTRCPGIERRATSTEHVLDQAKAERRKAPDGVLDRTTDEPNPTPPPAKKPGGRYAEVDRHAELHLDAESSRIARAAARRHRLTQPHLLERALHVANSPSKDTLLGAESWTTRDRMDHDPLGTLTTGIDQDALRQVLAAARTIASALGRARLKRTTARTIEPDTHGNRPKLNAPEQHPAR